MRSSKRVSTAANPSLVPPASRDPSHWFPVPRRLTVALACAEGDWSHDGWPTPDDPFVALLLHVSPPYRELRGSLREVVDVVVLRCGDPAAAFPELLSAMGDMDTPVIVVCPVVDTEKVVDVFRDGGRGYLVEGDYSTRMLSAAVMGVTEGIIYLSPVACSALGEGTRRIAFPERDGAGRLQDTLTRRERQIMELLSTGLGAREIGMRLGLSEKTVRNHLSSVYAKLGVRGSREAILRWLGVDLDPEPAHSMGAV